MEFYGDFCGQEYFPDDALFTASMSTAIARIYTQEGFVVAADGRKLDGKTGEIASDEVQKIFRLRHRAGELACSVAGAAQFVSELGMFDFGVEASHAALATAMAVVKNPDEYTELLRLRICEKLEAFNPASLSSFTEAKTYIFLDGYLQQRPMRRTITFSYEATGIASEVSAEELVPGRIKAYGSRIIMAFLSPNIAAKFQAQAASYLPSYRLRCLQPDTLARAVDAALAAIQAHCDPQALTIDPEVCRAVGGRIHAVTITPQRGCEWVPGSEPIGR